VQMSSRQIIISLLKSIQLDYLLKVSLTFQAY
jgi:hypothetical protein